MDLIRHFSPDLLSEALTDWQWLTELAGKRPLATSAFGDVFLQGDDGVVGRRVGGLDVVGDGLAARLRDERDTPVGDLVAGYCCHAWLSFSCCGG